MTPQEFYNEFDVKYNSISSNQAPGLNAYEKSVLLTAAQESLIKDIYTGTFEEDEKARRILDEIVIFTEVTPTEENGPYAGTVYNLPEDVWLITQESVTLQDSNLGCMNDSELDIVPVTQDEYNRVRKNPFKGPTKRQVLRLDIGQKKILLISKYALGNYTVGYIKKPDPIILEPLNYESIDGQTEVMGCSLNSLCHRDILDRAVALAFSIYRNTRQE